MQHAVWPCGKTLMSFHASSLHSTFWNRESWSAGSKSILSPSSDAILGLPFIIRAFHEVRYQSSYSTGKKTQAPCLIL